MSQVRRRGDEEVLAERDEWELVKFPKKDPDGEWLGLKLYRHTEEGAKWGKKRTFWLSWNGERFARGRDIRVLIDHYPGTLRWVHEAVRGGV